MVGRSSRVVRRVSLVVALGFALVVSTVGAASASLLPAQPAQDDTPVDIPARVQRQVDRTGTATASGSGSTARPISCAAAGISDWAERGQFVYETLTAVADSWGLNAINAPQVWDLNYTAAGITVANIDTGVPYPHTALQSKYRGHNPDGTYDNNYNFDIPDTCGGGAPCDSDQHGTHTMGTIVGGDGANQIGVAPDATWIASNCIDNAGCEFDDYLANAQWFLAPTRTDGSDPNPAMRPHVVSNSWGIPAGLDLPEDWMSAETQAWNAAASSAPGPAATRVRPVSPAASPASSSTPTRSARSTSNDVIASFSSRGPSALDGGVKPNVTAPGVDVRSSSPR